MSTHLIRRPFVFLVGFALLLALSGFLAPPTARATSPLTIDSLSCESGASHFVCYSSVSGGTGSYSGYWQATNVWYFTSADVYGSSGFCAAPYGVSMKLVVYDSSGAMAEKTRSFSCWAGDWP
jgi:hypothetical protein